MLKDYQLTAERYKILELIPWGITYLQLIFPVSDSSANIDAIVKPYQWAVIYSKISTTSDQSNFLYLIILGVVIATPLDRRRHFRLQNYATTGRSTTFVAFF